MKPEIKDYFSSDVENVWTWEPSDPTEIFFDLQLEIGDANDSHGTLFQVNVASPEGIRARAKHLPEVIGSRVFVVVGEFSWATLQKELESIVAKCEGATWDDCVAKLSRYFQWEYEDHKYV